MLVAREERRYSAIKERSKSVENARVRNERDGKKVWISIHKDQSVFYTCGEEEEGEGGSGRSANEKFSCRPLYTHVQCHSLVYMHMHSTKEKNQSSFLMNVVQVNNGLHYHDGYKAHF